MNARIAALLLVAVAIVQPLPAQTSPTIMRGSNGQPLTNAKVLSFDGLEFQVEHDGGIARVHWDRMPVALRGSNQLNLEMAAAGGKAAADKRAEDNWSATRVRLSTQVMSRMGIEPNQPAQNNTSQLPPPVPPVDSALRQEVTVPMMSRSHLVRLGGPNVFLTVQSADALEIKFRLEGGNFQSVKKKTGFGDQLTLLHDDHLGCKTYFVERTNRDPNDAILLFEHQNNSVYRPRGS